MQTAVIATADLSVCLSVRHVPVFFPDDTIVPSSMSDRTIVLVSGEVMFIRISQGLTRSDGVKVKRPPVASENLTNNQP